MRSQQKIVTLLLCSVMITSLLSSLVQQATSQAFTTVATTGFTTENVYSTQDVGVTTRTATVTSVFLETTDFAGGGSHYCWYDSWTLYVSPGTLAVTGTIGPAGAKVDFYIMTDNQFANLKGGSCETSYYGVVTVVGLTSAYSLNWNNPPPGVYTVVVFDEFPKQSFTVPITIDVRSTQEQMSSVYHVVTSQLILPVTHLTALQVTRRNPIQNISTLGAAAGIAVLLAVVFVLAKREGKKAKQRKEKPKPSQAAETKPPEQTTVTEVPAKEPVALPEKQAELPTQKLPTEQFCINCGSKLPTDSKFCNKCGTKQP